MVIRTLPRAPRALSASLPCIRTSPSLLRKYQSSARCPAPMFAATQQSQFVPQPQQTRSAHAIANPTLAGIEKRWEGMPPQEQAELWMQLRDRMKVDWNEMTLQEKKAGMATPIYIMKPGDDMQSITVYTNPSWWIAFGPHGPRAETPPGEWSKVMWYTVIGVSISGVLFYGIHSLARPQPRTMTKEWQEATNEYLKQEKINPIYGISSEGYDGKGYVQSKSAKARGIELEPEE